MQCQDERRHVRFSVMFVGIAGGLFISEVPTSLSYREWCSVRYLWSISCFSLWLKVNGYPFKVWHCWGMLIFFSEKFFQWPIGMLDTRHLGFIFWRKNTKSWFYLCFFVVYFVLFSSWCLEAWLDYLCMKPYFTGITESVNMNIQFWSQNIDFVWPIAVKQNCSRGVHSARFVFKYTIAFKV